MPAATVTPLRPVALALLFAAGAAVGPSPSWAEPSAPPAADTSVTAEALEARHGLKVTRVAVTGDGGLVDLRFTVTDPVKAGPLLGGGHDVRLLVGRDGLALEAPHHGGMRGVRVAKDAACYLLFPNVRGTVRRGGQVDVAFGGVTLRQVAVQ